MRNLLVFVLVAVSVGILFFCHSYWEEKTTFTSGMKTAEKNEDLTVDERGSGGDDYLGKAGKWPQSAKYRYEKLLLEEIPFQIVIAGSSSNMENERSWATLTKDAIKQAYGKTVSVDLLSFAGNSAEFDVENITGNKPDLVLLEPFLMADNSLGFISYDELSGWIDDIYSANKEATVILQAANPFYMPEKYQQQVNELMVFAEENNLVFLDHWEAWPDTDDDTISDYLTNLYYPNELGHELWSDYLINYFISE